ncbi:uncharacterized protein LOC129792404 [Lutzomyia longipalpis]|nr:uncharacterized protein LOC129792404 [Lutzomyia longipalpis]
MTGEMGDPPDPGGSSAMDMDMEGDERNEHAHLIEVAGENVNGGGIATGAIPKEKRVRSDGETVARVRKYAEGAAAPFIVYVRAKNKNSMSICRVSGALFAKYVGIENIDPVNRDKLKVNMTSRDDANKLVEDKDFCEKNFVYIPANRAEVSGKIFMNDCEDTSCFVSEGYGILNGDTREIKVVDAHRLKKKVVENDKTRLISTPFVRIVFAGTTLPDYVIVNKLRIPVQAYAPKIFECNNCLRLGHTEARCGARKRCEKCGLIHNEGEDSVGCTGEGSFRCPNCRLLYANKVHKCPKIKDVKDRAVTRAITNRDNERNGPSNNESRNVPRRQERRNNGQKARVNNTNEVQNIPTKNRFGALGDQDEESEVGEIYDVSETADSEMDEEESMDEGWQGAAAMPRKRKNSDRQDDNAWFGLADEQGSARVKRGRQITPPTAPGPKKKLPPPVMPRDSAMMSDISNFGWKDVVLLLLRNCGMSKNCIAMIENFVLPCIENMLGQMLVKKLKKSRKHHGSSRN